MFQNVTKNLGLVEILCNDLCNGNGHENWNLEYEESLQVRVSEDSCKIISDLYLMGAQVKCKNNGTEPAEDYTFFYRKVNKNYQLCMGLLYIRDSNQHLREQTLLVTTHHIWYYIIFVRKFQCSIRERTYFQNNNWE